jgi:hypothetical protein
MAGLIKPMEDQKRHSGGRLHEAKPSALALEIWKACAATLIPSVDIRLIPTKSPIPSAEHSIREKRVTQANRVDLPISIRPEPIVPIPAPLHHVP